MNENVDTTEVSGGPGLEIPVGVLVEGGSCESAERVVDRASQQGHRVLVGTMRGVPQGTVKRFEDYPSTQVVSLDAAGPEGAHSELVTAAHEAGFREVLVYTPADTDVDGRQPSIRGSGRTGGETAPETHSQEQILVGIPAYNEEIGIGSVVTSAQRHAEEVVVVDDGSSDDTAAIARQAGATVIEHEQNRGKGDAIETLLVRAETVSPDVLVLLDGDGQHRTDDIPAVAEPALAGDADLVLGSRYLGDENGGETPFYRRIGQTVLDIGTFATSGERVSDSQSGFRALSPDAIEQLSIDSEAFGVESGMIDEAAAADLTIDEVPVDVRYEGVPGAQTQNPLRHGLSVLAFVLQLIRDRHPLFFFAVPGSLLMAGGGLYGIDAILIYQLSGRFYPAKVLGSGFLIMFGMLSAFTGIILNRIGNIISHREND